MRIRHTPMAILVILLGLGTAGGASAAPPVIEALDGGGERTATPAPADPEAADGNSIEITVTAGEGGESRSQRFVRGVRDTLVSDTYRVPYIERMELDDRAELQPVIGEVEFGRWVDMTVTAITPSDVTAVVHYVRKVPANVAPDAEGPAVELPVANMSMVSRPLTLPRGASRDFRIRDEGDGLRLRLTAPEG